MHRQETVALLAGAVGAARTHTRRFATRETCPSCRTGNASTGRGLERNRRGPYDRLCVVRTGSLANPLCLVIRLRCRNLSGALEVGLPESSQTAQARRDRWPQQRAVLIAF